MKKELMTEITKARNCAESANKKTLFILDNHVKKNNKRTIENKAIPTQDMSLIFAGYVPRGGTQQPFPALRKRVCISDRSHARSKRVL